MGEEATFDPELDEAPEEQSTAVSPLVLMSDNTPESWLGQFLLALDLGGATRYSTIHGAKRDQGLKSRLTAILLESAQQEPLRLLQEGEVAGAGGVDNLSTRWKSQDALSRYAYSVMALAMLGDRTHVRELWAMHLQSANTRIAKDAHYVLCYLLGKPWPMSRITEGDLRRLEDEASAEGEHPDRQ